MKVEIISVGTRLLLGDIVDTNAAYVTRSLQETGLDVRARMTVGDNGEALLQAIQDGTGRAEAVIILDGSAPTERVVDDALEVAGRLGLADVHHLSYERDILQRRRPPGEGRRPCQLIVLPGERRELAFLLENRVLPYLQRRRQRGQKAARVSGWTLLRAVGVMESSLREQLGDLVADGRVRISYDSYAGQTNIRLWREADSRAHLERELDRLRQAVTTRLGDHIFGTGEARLEQVVLALLRESGTSLALAECHTHHALAQTLSAVSSGEPPVRLLPAATGDELADLLHRPRLAADGDLSRWCREAADALLAQQDTDLALVIYNNITAGGMQVLVTLASPRGVSVIQRSFGGHPDHIDQWAVTLGLAHLRRWLLVHA